MNTIILNQVEIRLQHHVVKSIFAKLFFLTKIIWLLPRNLVVLLLKIYRKFISPLYGEICKYHPSCSGYSLIAIQNCGLIIGSIFTIIRLLKCNPFSKGGIMDAPKLRHNYFRVLDNDFVVPKNSLTQQQSIFKKLDTFKIQKSIASKNQLIGKI